MNARTRSTRSRTRTGLAIGCCVVLALGASACDSDDAEPDDTVVDELESDIGVPFDNDVPPGVGTDTNENNNLGFDTDDLGPVGNQTNPND